MAGVVKFPQAPDYPRSMAMEVPREGAMERGSESRTRACLPQVPPPVGNLVMPCSDGQPQFAISLPPTHTQNELPCPHGGMHSEAPIFSLRLTRLSMGQMAPCSFRASALVSPPRERNCERSAKLRLPTDRCRYRCLATVIAKLIRHLRRLEMLQTLLMI